MNEPAERLKWLAFIVDACANIKGGAVISAFLAYSAQGSAVIQGMVSRLLNHVWTPFLTFLRQWIYFGELFDQYGEFFITYDPNVGNDRLWTEAYALNPEMLPSSIDVVLAERILTTGKSVNFLRRCCSVQNWVLDLPFIEVNVLNEASMRFMTHEEQPKPDQMILEVSKDKGGFAEWVGKACSQTSAKVLDVLFSSFSFRIVIESLKKYLLLGAGDFIQYLMDLLFNELKKSATQLYKHSLQGILETAIRGSNAQFHPPEAQERLDVKLLAASTGDTGWDVFSLDFRVEAPLTTVFTQEVMVVYLRIFNFLWRVKRVQHSLSAVWTRDMKARPLLSKLKELRSDIHRCNLLRHEMTHFFDIFFNYLMVEVIESAWNLFMKELADVKDLDHLIQIHRKFLTQVMDKALLSQENQDLYRAVLKLFELALRFKTVQDTLFDKANEEYQKRVSMEKDQEMYQHIEDDHESPAQLLMKRNRASVMSVPKEAIMQIHEIEREYKKQFANFHELLKKNDSQGKLRFLIFRVDFNEYYSGHSMKMGDNEDFGNRISIPRSDSKPSIMPNRDRGARLNVSPSPGHGYLQTGSFQRKENDRKDMSIEPQDNLLDESGDREEGEVVSNKYKEEGYQRYDQKDENEDEEDDMEDRVETHPQDSEDKESEKRGTSDLDPLRLLNRVISFGDGEKKSAMEIEPREEKPHIFTLNSASSIGNIKPDEIRNQLNKIGELYSNRSAIPTIQSIGSTSNIPSAVTPGNGGGDTNIDQKARLDEILKKYGLKKNES
eukprot:TRINITY_DN3927_c0_g2_i1.p1 TRINITY_DN3927_c0_g2~~TRINITY_DN3927_c0_g2_i1.p1  ORF type:complete len:778 (-),score=173.88 TRINITY_DN3927_c0_g2_i1:54-2387(-)